MNMKRLFTMFTIIQFLLYEADMKIKHVKHQLVTDSSIGTNPELFHSMCSAATAVADNW